MKKFLLIGCLILITACQSSNPTLVPEFAPTVTLPPTLIPATTAPTFTPAPTDTPIPIPPPRYFTDEFDTSSAFWQFSQTGGTTDPLTTFENGTLRIDIASADTWHLGIHNANTYSNVFVRAKVSANAAGSAGLICRYDESKGWFEFNIDSEGTYSLLLGQWLAPSIAKYIPIATDGSSQLGIGNVNYEIGLFCQDNLVNLYVNEVLLRRLDVTNYGLIEGNIGIAVSSYQQAPMSAVFEWVKISEE